MEQRPEVGLDAGPVTRPRWVWWQGARRPVIAVEFQRDEPERTLYRVLLASGERLVLVYRRDDSRWSVTPATPPFGLPVA